MSAQGLADRVLIDPPYAATAEAYLAAGWAPLPLPAGRKKSPPKGYTGEAGAWPTSGRVQKWVRDRGAGNVGLRLPANVVGIDVDDHSGKGGGATLRDLEQKLGPLPPTWIGTSRDDGVSGIRFFRAPEGVKWPDFGAGIEALRHGYRYAVVWPSDHPDTGQTYKWFDPDGNEADAIPRVDDLPELPAAWADYFASAVDGTSASEAPTPTATYPTAFADLEPSQKVQATARVNRTLVGFRERLLAAAVWDDGVTDECGRGWELLTRDACWSLAGLAVAPWAPLTLKEANAAYADMVPAVIAANEKCRGRLPSDRVEAAAARMPAPPWVEEDFGPVPDEVVESVAVGAGSGEIAARLRTGGAFLLDIPDHIPAVWGRDEEVLWAEGESLTIAGPPGVGKTTLAGQVVGARLAGGTVLGYPVAATGSRVLYLAMDRPRQIARALNRSLADLGRGLLDERLVFWPGPPLQDVAAHPGTMLALAKAARADTVVVDSIKDAAVGLSNDDVGAGYNRARQLCIAEGVEVLELHHMVKRGNGGPPTSLADMYGSTWIGAGAGSVLLLHGAAGDPVVAMRHLKQPGQEVGPYQLMHDHVAGVTTIWHSTDLLQMARIAGAQGITARQVACAIEDTAKPTPAQLAKATRRLTTLTDSGHLVCTPGQRGGANGGTPTVWVLKSDYASDYAS